VFKPLSVITYNPAPFYLGEGTRLRRADEAGVGVRRRGLAIAYSYLVDNNSLKMRLSVVTGMEALFSPNKSASGFVRYFLGLFVLIKPAF